jgi:chromosome segregation ATPase
LLADVQTRNSTAGLELAGTREKLAGALAEATAFRTRALAAEAKVAELEALLAEAKSASSSQVVSPRAGVADCASPLPETTASEEMQSLKYLHSQLLAKHEIMCQELSQVQAAKADLEKNHTLKVQKMTIQQKELSSQNKALNNTCKDLSAQCEQLSGLNEDVSLQYQTVAAELDKLREQHRGLDATLTEVRTHSEFAKGAFLSSQKELEFTKAKLEGANSQLAQTTKDFEQLSAEHKSLFARHKDLYGSRDSAATENKKLSAKHAELSARFEQLSAEHKQLAHEHKQLQLKPLTDQELAQQSDIRRALEQLHDDCTHANEALAAARQELEEVSADRANLRSQLDVARGELREWEDNHHRHVKCAVVESRECLLLQPAAEPGSSQQGRMGRLTD